VTVKYSTRTAAAVLCAQTIFTLGACGGDDNGSTNAGTDSGAGGVGNGSANGNGGDAAAGNSGRDAGAGVRSDAGVGLDSSTSSPGVDAGKGDASALVEGGALPEASASESGSGDTSTGPDASPGPDAGAGGDSGSGTTGQTASGVAVPTGWTLKAWDQFGTGGNVTNFSQLHAKYYEAQFYNRDSSGLVTIPNTVINGEQETYSHFETVIAWASDHLTIQARGQSDGSITSGEMVSKYTARSFCTEAKYRIPSTKGSWPAFWFYGSASGDQSEFDVEQPITSGQGVSDVSMYNHPGQSNVVIADPAFTTQYMTWSKPSFNGNTAPHNYTVCYDDSKSKLTRYIDGGLIYTATFTWNQSLGGTGKGPDAATIVNLAVGGSWPGNVSNPSSFKDDLDVYWIQYFAP
jgi:hypothetical protein